MILLISASQVARITGLSHCAWLQSLELKDKETEGLRRQSMQKGQQSISNLTFPSLPKIHTGHTKPRMQLQKLVIFFLFCPY
jgi:hypothetical protein